MPPASPSITADATWIAATASPMRGSVDRDTAAVSVRRRGVV
jgi:hypothetical protein